MMEGPWCRFRREARPASDIDTVVVDSLKALDPEWPIREADIGLIWGESPSYSRLFGRHDRDDSVRRQQTLHSRRDHRGRARNSFCRYVRRVKDDQTIALLCPRSADQMRLARKH